MQQYAIFYRNMNLGHRGSPVRAQLEAALAGPGVATVRSFQTNGTVLLTATPAAAAAARKRAAPQLLAAAGYQDTAFIRPVAGLESLLAAKPFAGLGDERTYRETLTLFDGDASNWELPWTNARDSLDLVAGGVGYVLSVVRGQQGASGDPNSEVERRIGDKATTRTIGTIERLLRAAAAIRA